MSFSIRMSKKERQLADSYAKLHGVSLAEAMKSAFFEKIEEEYDLAIYHKALEDYKNNPKTYTLDEIKEIYNIK